MEPPTLMDPYAELLDDLPRLQRKFLRLLAGAPAPLPIDDVLRAVWGYVLPDHLRDRQVRRLEQLRRRSQRSLDAVCAPLLIVWERGTLTLLPIPNLRARTDDAHQQCTWRSDARDP